MKCKICRAEVERRYLTQKTCLDPVCVAEQKRQDKLNRNARQAIRKRAEAIKSRSEYMREAQAVFNAYIRFRDKNDPCISCFRFHEGQWHAGHYRSTKAAPELRFSPLNVHKQCQPCNTHLSGNIIEYRKSLILKIGPAALEWLEGPQEPMHYTIEDLKAIKQHYKQQLKELKNGLL